ncbi:hypothetical protein TREMEDRAFT_65643 [Tremella mesenterica DSM 1558]|uniref:uncharacterized protein n=1 Tax=Tremella mesenterica (strain ATCC 24925 / CBS 8224 / DSM 1558 / NBRC 9311 / NRRL Y-6157 / RJB 2259-6 / UBC 559-6) TaxID=578456 RepID=UPI00032D663C|nr:uncharacterized protein TREMEDRAFT_65643 [Tremella mesenterica DSM 1558]EIW66364.1 hypothetical protein TREMEDRAFT_65643 [Tremella mesenterica DSM 1558]
MSKPRMDGIVQPRSILKNTSSAFETSTPGSGSGPNTILSDWSENEEKNTGKESQVGPLTSLISNLWCRGKTDEGKSLSSGSEWRLDVVYVWEHDRIVSLGLCQPGTPLGNKAVVSTLNKIYGLAYQDPELIQLTNEIKHDTIEELWLQIVTQAVFDDFFRTSRVKQVQSQVGSGHLRVERVSEQLRDARGAVSPRGLFHRTIILNIYRRRYHGTQSTITRSSSDPGRLRTGSITTEPLSVARSTSGALTDQFHTVAVKNSQTLLDSAQAGNSEGHLIQGGSMGGPVREIKFGDADKPPHVVVKPTLQERVRVRLEGSAEPAGVDAGR